MVLITSLLVCVIVYLIYLWRKNINDNYWKVRNIPFVKKTTPFGWTLDFVLQKKPMGEMLKGLYDAYENEPCVGFFLGSHPALLLRHPENIQAALSSDFHSFSSRGIPTNPNDLLADNVLFINDYRRWKLLRQKLSPVFTSAKLKNMFYIIERCARDFVDFVHVADKMANKFDLLYTYSTASIGASVFGIDTQTKNTMDSPFIDMTKKALTTSPMVNVMFVLANTFPRLQQFLNIKQFAAHEDFFVGVVKNVLASRRMETHKRHDFIDLCLELQKNGTMKDLQTLYEMEPTDEVMAAQAFFFFIAGADTTANTMHFTLLELSNNSEILKRLHKEVDEVFQNSGDNLSYDDIDKLVYLDMVVNEAMRKYPPIANMQRACVKDTTLPVGNVKIDKGVIVFVPVFALHRDEKYFTNPEKFDPERFSVENVNKIPKFTYLPFGEGNRICIGIRFARLQLLAGLAWLLRRYTLEPQDCHPTKFEKSAFSLRAPDVNFNLVPRT